MIAVAERVHDSFSKLREIEISRGQAFVIGGAVFVLVVVIWTIAALRGPGRPTAAEAASEGAVRSKSVIDYYARAHANDPVAKPITGLRRAPLHR